MTDEELAVAVAMKQARMAAMGPVAVARSGRLFLEARGRETYRERIGQTAEDEVDDLMAIHGRELAGFDPALARDALRLAVGEMPADATENEIIERAVRALRPEARLHQDAPGGSLLPRP